MKKKIIVCAVLLLVLLFMTACGEDQMPQFYYSPGDVFITNIVGEDWLVKIGLELCMNDDRSELLAERNSLVRDCILRVLRNSTLEDFQAVNMQDILREKILAELNILFPIVSEKWGPLFINITFTDFVMQQ
jgi:flagellar basal body-associated protein FliL